MAEVWIKPGAAFRVTCDIRDEDGVAQVNPSTSSGVVINYRRPDGTIGTLTPDITTSTTVSAKVTATLNPSSVAAGDPRWKSGYPGAWEFFPSGTDSGGDPWEAKEALVQVHTRFRNVT